MLVDRHHAQYLIDLGHVAEGKSAEQLAPLKDRLETFLDTLSGGATPAARRVFEEQLERLAKNDRPWAAIRRPDPTTHIAPDTSTPRRTSPAVALLLAQVDDDPDSDEDGNRIPDVNAADAGPWVDLHQALLRWDTAEIQRWIGPLGWQSPTSPMELTQEPELTQDAPTPQPGTPSQAAVQAAHDADERSRKTLRAVGITAAISGGGALLFGLGRSLANPHTPPGASMGAKDETP